MSLNHPLHASINDICARHAISRSQIYRLLGEGRIEAIKLGRRIKIIVATADAYFAGRPRAKIKPEKKRSRQASAASQEPAA